MQKLTATDAAFLYLETPETPMHVGSLHLLELTPEQQAAKAKTAAVTRIRKHIKERLHLAPLFSRRLNSVAFDVTTPTWVHGDKVDLNHHIQHIHLAPPGSMHQLERVIADLHSRLMDRSKPMWEFYVVTGLAQDGNFGSSPQLVNHVALYSKIHHCALDGQGGVALAQAILDLTPAGRSKEQLKQSAAAAKQTSSRTRATLRTVPSIWSGAADLAGNYASLVRGLPSILGSTSRTVSAAVTQVAGKALASLAARSSATDEDDDEHVSAKGIATTMRAFNAHLVGPKTHFNASIGAERSFATATVSLPAVKAVGKALDATINDVVLLLCSTALRQYLALHDNHPHKPLIAAVPISLRSSTDGSSNNQVTMLPISLASHLKDVRKQLAAIQSSASKVKTVISAIKGGGATKLRLPTIGVPWLFKSLNTMYARSKLADKVPPIANLVISNVPGPQIPLYLAGSLVKTFYPLSIPVHGLGLNITVQSYNNRMDIGITAARSAVKDADVLASLMVSALHGLEDEWVIPTQIPIQKKPARAKPRVSARKTSIS